MGKSQLRVHLSSVRFELCHSQTRLDKNYSAVSRRFCFVVLCLLLILSHLPKICSVLLANNPASTKYPMPIDDPHESFKRLCML